MPGDDMTSIAHSFILTDKMEASFKYDWITCDLFNLCCKSKIILLILLLKKIFICLKEGESEREKVEEKGRGEGERA